ncbi:putative F-box/LRR-repeat protein 23 [Momordica charantia]|uniref:F-box/LRR-repeat protein 23 n=1 Tax=Momordica charantia TaxID=3673 RepID=A0A6J1CYW9_MOMCH|nr:putative F-box/LRR-repeat protein 23 [Momordica charantia]
MESNSNPNSEEPARNWLELPADTTSMILMKLGAVDILSNAQIVCSLWRKICYDPLMWRVVDMRNLDDSLDMDKDLEKMCMQAVDRSCGQLVDINIERFGTDELLHYIAQSSNQLRRLRLVYCHDISGKGLAEAVPKLPLLEDLEIFFSFDSFDMETLKTVGRCCPLLNSLKLHNRNCKGPRLMGCDEEALAIAENMPNLRHLGIFSNSLTDLGLQAILDGCPYLESLDLRHCLNLNLGGQLEKKCSKRIKSLQLPYDPIDDCDLYDNLYIDSDYEEFLRGTSIYGQ